MSQAATRARSRGIEFALHWADILPALLSGCCEVTGLPFHFGLHPHARSHPLTPSLDRRNPRRGYTPDNVQVVVDVYNRAKADYTHESVMIVARALVQRDSP